MGKYEKLLTQLLQGRSDANIAFAELCQLLLRMGFEERVLGSHHIFRKIEVAEKSICRAMVTKQSRTECARFAMSWSAINWRLMNDGYLQV